MAARKPIVVDSSGRQTELPSGDTISGVATSFPFYLADSTPQFIPINSSNELPFYLANGTAQNIPVVVT